MIAHDYPSMGFIALALLIAVFWGAAHAFSPGHGKSIVAAVTITPPLGLVTLALSAFIVPEQIYPWLNVASALLVVGVGVSVLRWRLRDVLAAPPRRP